MGAHRRRRRLDRRHPRDGGRAGPPGRPRARRPAAAAGGGRGVQHGHGTRPARLAALPRRRRLARAEPPRAPRRRERRPLGAGRGLLRFRSRRRRRDGPARGAGGRFGRAVRGPRAPAGVPGPRLPRPPRGGRGGRRVRRPAPGRRGLGRVAAGRSDRCPLPRGSGPPRVHCRPRASRSGVELAPAAGRPAGHRSRSRARSEGIRVQGRLQGRLRRGRPRLGPPSVRLLAGRPLPRQGRQRQGPGRGRARRAGFGSRPDRRGRGAVRRSAPGDGSRGAPLGPGSGPNSAAASARPSLSWRRDPRRLGSSVASCASWK